MAKHTWTACRIGEPFDSSAAIHDASVQPVPWVLRVIIRSPRSSWHCSPK